MLIDQNLDKVTYFFQLKLSCETAIKGDSICISQYKTMFSRQVQRKIFHLLNIQAQKQVDKCFAIKNKVIIEKT